MQTKTTSSSLVLEVPHATRNTVHLCECYLCISSPTRTVSAPDVPGSPQACPLPPAPDVLWHVSAKQPGCLRRIKMRRKKESVRPANGWFMRTQITITGWNQIIKWLVCGSPSLAGSGCPFQPEQLTAVSVDIFCVENETDLLGRRCAKFYDRKRPLKSCILWHAPR